MATQTKTAEETLRELLKGTKEVVYKGVVFRNGTVPGYGWAVIGAPNASKETTNQETEE